MNIWLMNDIVNSLIQIKIDTPPPPKKKPTELWPVRNLFAKWYLIAIWLRRKIYQTMYSYLSIESLFFRCRQYCNTASGAHKLNCAR